MADSVQIEAVGGIGTVDDGQRAMRDLAGVVLKERVRMGLDLPERELEMIAGLMAVRAREILKKVFFYAYQLGAVHGTEDEDKIPTRPQIKIPSREMLAVTPPKDSAK